MDFQTNSTKDQRLEKLYRQSVGIMILNKEKKIFLGKRLNTKDKKCWQMPQGGIDVGENAETAMKRELFEETSIKNIKIIAKSDNYHYYNFPHDIRKKLWNGRYVGQKQKWFLMEFTGEDDEINISTSEPEFSEWKWSNVNKILEKVVDFKKETYEKILLEFKDFIK